MSTHRSLALALAASAALASPSRAAGPEALWHASAFADGSYADDLNHPSNHLFRGRGTTPLVGQPVLNMAGVGLRKDAAESSRWGLELGAQTGKDAKAFGYSATSPNIDHGDALSHIAKANVSYLAPVGSGLTVQAGLFGSLIGEESLYAKDNFNYTRAWISDFSPYLMFGANASYAFDEKDSAALYVVNEYFHLSRSNAEPAYGVQYARKQAPGLTLKETVFYGPDQRATAVGYWRLFSDSIVEWRAGERVSTWLAYDVGTERLAEQAGEPRVFWMGAAAAARWNVSGPWSVAERPEFYWDRNGRLTGSRQLVEALTSTLEYKAAFGRHGAIVRLEHRYDFSTGPDGGFYRGGDSVPGTPGLRPSHHMVIAALIWTFDA
ncbi:MAG: outer membrane beta-barrel protein [Elusimicrobia bacterium]|nr:outer membrane beta-barrel protein [Elusimicrobiota bacterium]